MLQLQIRVLICGSDRGDTVIYAEFQALVACNSVDEQDKRSIRKLLVGSLRAEESAANALVREYGVAFTADNLGAAGIAGEEIDPLGTVGGRMTV